MEKTNWVAAVSSGSQPIHWPDQERTISRASSDFTPRRTKSARRSSSFARTRRAHRFSGFISRKGPFARIRVPTAARPTEHQAERVRGVDLLPTEGECDGLALEGPERDLVAVERVDQGTGALGELGAHVDPVVALADGVDAAAGAVAGFEDDDVAVRERGRGHEAGHAGADDDDLVALLADLA